MFHSNDTLPKQSFLTIALSQRVLPRAIRVALIVGTIFGANKSWRQNATCVDDKLGSCQSHFDLFRAVQCFNLVCGGGDQV